MSPSNKDHKEVVMVRVGDLFSVNGERLILKDDEDKTTLFFHARDHNKYISKYAFNGMIQSGEATLIRHKKEEKK